jgi:hypothetical protein
MYIYNIAQILFVTCAWNQFTNSIFCWSGRWKVDVDVDVDVVVEARDEKE